jgi:hypothetical protein
MSAKPELVHKYILPGRSVKPLLSIHPKMLATDLAGPYCGFSGESFKKLRDKDRRNLDEGKTLDGPAWCETTIPGKKILYKVEVLDRWLDRYRLVSDYPPETNTKQVNGDSHD